jgi:hypothetical protein
MATLRYPSELQAGSNTDYLEIKFVRRDYSSSRVNYTTEDNSNTIILNIPQKISENISQNFANASLGTLGMLDAFGNRQGMAGGIGSGVMAAALQKYLEGVALENSLKVMNKLGASSVTENGVLSGASGIVYNPNLEVLYEGPDFRSFNFQFALFTRSKNDAKAIKSIVDEFRERSLPRTNGSISNADNVQKLFSSIAGIQVAAGIGQGLAGGAGAIVSGLVGGKSLTVPGLTSAIASAGGGNLGSGVSTGVIGGLAGSGVFNGNNRFIKQPPFILVTYKRGSSDHPFIKPLLPAAINQINFDFTPTGNYTTLANFDATDEATTIGVTITMQLTEVTNLFGDTLFNNRAPGVSGASTPTPSTPTPYTLNPGVTPTPLVPGGAYSQPGGGLGGPAGIF